MSGYGDQKAEARDEALQRRRAPASPIEIVARFDDGGHVEMVPAEGSVTLQIEATDCNGEIAAWLDDHWWTKLIQQWTDRFVDVLFGPTPGAILHPVVLYHAEMLRRVVPEWRTVAHAFRSDMRLPDDAAAIAKSFFHEVRFFDGDRPGITLSDRRLETVRLEELFGDVRRHQAERGTQRPVLTRLPSGSANGFRIAPQPIELERNVASEIPSQVEPFA